MTAVALAWDPAAGKVHAAHLERLAVVYVRQSTRKQVLENTESARLQYGLVERAVGLGWARSRVLVIDDDLGCSAGVADGRPGFQKLVTEVTMGRVGIVLGIEMSRLARTGRDWHQLLELCSLAGALLADPDGVYDPAQYNDRLLLGLKGTMSEAELYLIRQRMMGGRLAKARRGELALPVPIGYVRRPSGEVILEPDEQARDTVALVFRLFEELLTLNAVLRYLAGHGIDLPVRLRSGPDTGELEWHRPSRETLQNMLHNPIYAGFYAYGRKQVDPRRKKPGRPATGLVVTACDDWYVFLPDRYPAYISADQYRANQERLARNRNTANHPGTVREGPALLPGLLHCVKCGGHRMAVQYQVQAAGDTRHAYTCVYLRANFGIEQVCQNISGRALDRYVVDQVLAAIAPAALEASMRAAEHLEAERATLDKLWRQRLERAAFTADRARRQYRLAEPENRLVVRQLEADWEQALAEQAELADQYARFTAASPPTLSTTERAAIRALAADIPALWTAPTTTNADRKQIIRAVIDRIEVDTVGNTERVDVAITWAGGHTTYGQAIRPVARLEQLSYYPRIVQLVTTAIAAGQSYRQIADQLNAEGLRPPKRREAFGPQGVRDLVARLHLRHPDQRTGRPRPPGPQDWWMADLARELDMPTITLYSWITRGWVTAAQQPEPPHRWYVTADQTELARLREVRTHSRGFGSRQRFLDAHQQQHESDMK